MVPFESGLRVLQNTRPLLTSLIWANIALIISAYIFHYYLNIHGFMLAVLISHVVEMAFLFYSFNKTCFNIKHKNQIN